MKCIIVYNCRDERWMKVFVGSAAEVEVLVTQVNDAMLPDTTVSLAKVGDRLKIICTVDGGQPPPLLSTMLGEDILPSEEEYQVTREQAGQVLVFSCVWQQVGPLGQVLYSGRETGEPVQVILPPEVGHSTPTSYTATGQGGCNISIPFTAAPWDKDSKVTWWIIQGDNKRVLVQEMMEDFGHFKIDTLQWGHDKMEAFLSVSGLSRDINLLVDIENLGGFSQFPVSISLESALSAEMSAMMRDMEWFEMNICTVLGIAAGTIFAILLFLQVAFFIRHKRHGCKRFETNKMQFKM